MRRNRLLFVHAKKMKKVIAAAIFAASFITAFFYYWKTHYNVLSASGHDDTIPRLQPMNGSKSVHYEHAITLHNYGPVDIEVFSVETSCGCTKIIAPNKVKKFSSEKIVAIIDFPVSEIAKSVDIAVRSSAVNGVLILNANYEGGDFVSYYPDSVNLGSIYAGESSEVKTVCFFMTTPPGSSPQLCIGSAPEGIDCSISWADEKTKLLAFRDGTKSLYRECLISLKSAQNNETGVHDEKLQLRLGSDAETDITIPLRWKVIPQAAFEMDSYVFSPRQKTVPIIVKHGKRRISAENMRISNGNFKVAKITDISGGTELLVKYTGNAEKRESAEIEVCLEDDFVIKAELKYMAEQNDKFKLQSFAR